MEVICTCNKVYVYVYVTDKSAMITDIVYTFLWSNGS